VTVRITPAAEGWQLVRFSLPLPRGVLPEGENLMAAAQGKRFAPTSRVLTWYAPDESACRSVRRVMVTFPYRFTNCSPVSFTFKAGRGKPPKAHSRLAQWRTEGEALRLDCGNGPALLARMIAPPRASAEPPQVELVESNAFFRWERIRWPDAQWPRMIEVRADALGVVAVVAHLQRNLPGDGRAPDFGWEIETPASPSRLISSKAHGAIPSGCALHSFANGDECAFQFEDGRWQINHPTAGLKRRGIAEFHTNDTGRVLYRYLRCAADERVPMQQTAWQRAEFVVSPSGLASLTPTLETPHEIAVEWRIWDALYSSGPPVDVRARPELAALVRYHHDAIVRSMAVGVDLGNITGYTDGQEHGGVFGMNRLNHCPPIFEEAWRTGDRRLREVALLWCDNFHDQTIWWGTAKFGGTRYNNVRAQGRTPLDGDSTYMWRSNDSVHFCTKGYDSFLLAYEETGDPRMLEALEAQTAYAATEIHALGETRNVGDVRDFLRLFKLTGRTNFLTEALRLFREVRTKLSTGDLFDQGGKPIELGLPHIEEDQAGLRHGFAKPYIIGYALAGLPELIRFAPDEPKLCDVVRAVADFIAESQDPVGGWRYPHPRSSFTIMGQAMEHAWQLVQADRCLGPQEKHLDAIERVLRQRLHGWRTTGKVFSAVTGWELATGRVKANTELYQLYGKPSDRDASRDYVEGRPDFGSCPPEGLVYFPEVLAFYLKHRPVERLLTLPAAEEPLEKVLARSPEKGKGNP